ncbi:MAG: VanW family protein [Lachnospiraceae bacterium]|nr:VanW family protein [Lachnospiraceae bacterium]
MKKIIKAAAAGLIMSMCVSTAALATEEGGIVVIDPGSENETKINVSEDETIPEGIYFGNTPVGGMTVTQARTVIDNYVASVGDMKLRLTAPGGYADYDVSELAPVCNNADEMIAQAVGLKHVGSLISQYKQAKDLECNCLYIDYDIGFSMDGVMAFIVENSDKFERSARNASVKLNDNGSFSVINAQNGFTVDYDETYDNIKEALNACDFKNEIIACTVEGSETEPEYGDEYFEGFGAVLGEASTEHRTTGDQYNRAINVNKAVSMINGTVLMPGQQFSYCAALQPFTKAAGWVDAGTYTPTGVDQELGGGVCQISTTLYNAVLWSELQVDFRKNHSKVVDYVPYSMDAMVHVLSGQDFKFTNNTSHAIYIQYYTTSIGSGREKITCRIYGTEYRPASRKIEFVSVTDKTELPDPVYEILDDDTLDVYPADGDDRVYSYADPAAHIGINSHLVKNVYENGVLVQTTTLSRDRYAPLSGKFYKHPDSILKELKFDDQLGIISIKFVDPSKETTTAETTTAEETTTVDETTTAEETTTQEPTTEAPTACAHANTTTEGFKSASCTENGYTGDVKCLDCGQVISVGQVTEAFGHHFDGGVCTVCGAADPNYVPPEPVTEPQPEPVTEPQPEPATEPQPEGGSSEQASE